MQSIEEINLHPRQLLWLPTEKDKQSFVAHALKVAYSKTLSKISEMSTRKSHSKTPVSSSKKTVRSTKDPQKSDASQRSTLNSTIYTARARSLRKPSTQSSEFVERSFIKANCPSRNGNWYIKRPSLLDYDPVRPGSPDLVKLVLAPR